MRLLTLFVLASMSATACSSENTNRSLGDSATTDGAPSSGSGGAAGMQGGRDASGTGGAIGTGGGTVGIGSGGAGGGSGDASRDVNDSSIADGAQDWVARADTLPSGEGGVCTVGSTRSAGDGCNTCHCQSGGVWVCTTVPCASPDASCTDGSCGPPDAHLPPVDAGTPEAGTLTCAQITTQATCQARSDCHAVFADPNTCGCLALGCCTRFSRCADGGKAVCTPPASLACTIATPFCATPAYVLSYTASCYEGCVLPAECGS
jgi:hypothetical protein